MDRILESFVNRMFTLAENLVIQNRLTGADLRDDRKAHKLILNLTTLALYDTLERSAARERDVIVLPNNDVVEPTEFDHEEIRVYDKISKARDRLRRAELSGSEKVELGRAVTGFLDDVHGNVIPLPRGGGDRGGRESIPQLALALRSVATDIADLEAFVVRSPDLLELLRSVIPQENAASADQPPGRRSVVPTYEEQLLMQREQGQREHQGRHAPRLGRPTEVAEATVLHTQPLFDDTTSTSYHDGGDSDPAQRHRGRSEPQRPSEEHLEAQIVRLAEVVAEQQREQQAAAASNATPAAQGGLINQHHRAGHSPGHERTSSDPTIRRKRSFIGKFKDRLLRKNSDPNRLDTGTPAGSSSHAAPAPTPQAQPATRYEEPVLVHSPTHYDHSAVLQQQRSPAMVPSAAPYSSADAVYDPYDSTGPSQSTYGVDPSAPPHPGYNAYAPYIPNPSTHYPEDSRKKDKKKEKGKNRDKHKHKKKHREREPQQQQQQQQQQQPVYRNDSGSYTIPETTEAAKGGDRQESSSYPSDRGYLNGGGHGGNGADDPRWGANPPRPQHNAPPSEIPPTDPRMGSYTHVPEIVDDVLLEKKIGGGGFGTVYIGTWREMPVAVKVLNPPPNRTEQQQLTNSFVQETRILAQLSHPNIVSFIGKKRGDSDGELMIVTEYMAGGSLWDRIHSYDIEITIPDVDRWAFGIAQALEYLHLHRPQILHRDLKSPNVLLDDQGNVKVCDFGLSRTRLATTNTLTSHVGTPQWTAPEVHQSPLYDEKCDVYSFAVVVWEMFAREVPFRNMDPFQIFNSVKEGGRPRMPAGVPVKYRNLITCCWAEDPRMRPSFSEVLRYLQGDLDVLNRYLQQPPPLPVRRHRHHAIAVPAGGGGGGGGSPVIHAGAARPQPRAHVIQPGRHHVAGGYPALDPRDEMAWQAGRPVHPPAGPVGAGGRGTERPLHYEYGAAPAPAPARAHGGGGGYRGPITPEHTPPRDPYRRPPVDGRGYGVQGGYDRGPRRYDYQY